MTIFGSCLLFGFASQQPKSFKTDLASFVCRAVLLALPLVVRFGRLEA